MKYLRGSDNSEKDQKKTIIKKWSNWWRQVPQKHTLVQQGL